VQGEDGVQLSTFWLQLKLEASDGKNISSIVPAPNVCSVFIQSIPLPKTDPFKQWLAQVGYERVQEIENPEPRLFH
jgi:DNA-damage-inducible protein D